ncbi:MAG: DUF4214 domain-containing protein [Marinobacter sp.]|uniref:DUF4214 domain-containing protein n=1 Tax=Marinobacter sp. TaxID=50741 RepID=UPI001B56B41A|nr:DUF4214 domain-containing protein [Marinobacter sp.]MBQ0747908.1 DUF4214 domain-containing protein [Marinobacter sp.]MBQ0815016.1 DUF4214 domain-containing protein [Marinobacter sp.]
MATQTQINSLVALYVGYFDRAPDPQGLQFWIDQIDNGRAFNTIAEDFATSPEATALYPFLTTPDVSTPSTFIQSIYLNLFGRAAEAEGLNFWTGVLQSGSVSVADFIEAIINGAVDAPTATPPTFDKAVLDNKVTVGLDFATDAGNVANFTFDAAAKSAAVAAVNGVTEDPATVTDAQAATDAYLTGQVNVGQAFTLTTGVDNVVGTTGDDTITGVAANVAAGGTFNTGDSVNGGTGNDTLNLISTTGGTFTPASLTSVETVRVQDLSGTTFNMSNATGVQTLVSNNSNTTTNFVNMAAIAGIEVNSANNVFSGVAVNYNASVVTGLADEQNIAVSGANAAVSVNGIETFSVAATGVNTLNLFNNGSTVNVSGDGSLNLLNVSNVTTLDASANAGGVTATIGSGNVAVTGGTGDDSFNFGAGLTAASTGVAGDVVNGGDGMDTVRVTTSGDLSAAAAAAPFNALTSVERVSFDGTGVTLNGATFTNAGITNIEFNTNGNDVINNAGSARTYEFGTANNGTAVFNMNGTSTVLNLALLGTDPTVAANDGNDADVGAVTVNLSGTAPAGTLATINIDSQGDLAAGRFNDVGTITAVAGSTINISGAGDLDLTGLTHRGTIDASAATGNLVIEGSDSVNSAGDKITLGAGVDTVQFDSGLDSGAVNNTSAATTALGLQVDVVNSFTAGNGGDILDATIGAGDSDYTALVASAQAAINALSGAGATLQDAADIATNAIVQSGAAGEWSAFTFQGQSYAVYDAATDGNFVENNDLLVQLTGVTVADLTDANFA